MANYATVTVTIEAEISAVLSMYTALVNAEKAERKELDEDFRYLHLKYLLDNANIGDVEGQVLDYRSIIDCYMLKDFDTLYVDMEQPWSWNLERFAKWVMDYDPNAHIKFVCCEPMCEVLASNDKEFLATHPRYAYADI